MLVSAPPVKDVVLIGGGHAQVQVLRRLGMNPQPGLRVTLISREIYTPYSGMLPGYVAGVYDWEDIHIDLGPLCRFANARLIADEVTGIDLNQNRLQLAARPDIRFDYLSINSGAAPGQLGAGLLPVKPIGRFVPHWLKVQENLADHARILLIGAGAGGVELALAMRTRLPSSVELMLVTDRFMPDYPEAARTQLQSVLADAGVQLRQRHRVTGSSPGAVHVEGLPDLEFTAAFSVTGVVAPQWLEDSELELNADGFVMVDEYLRSTSHPWVLAAGDVAALQSSPRPKSGVFAVRAGPVLSKNLVRAPLGKSLYKFRPQQDFLSLVGLADGRALAMRGERVKIGRWAWQLKQRIDRRFMKRFQQLPAMAKPQWSLPPALLKEAPDPMRCGGCGAKLAADPLLRVLHRLPAQPSARVKVGIGDDAALISNGHAETFITVDGFRDMVNDPYLFGRITAHHSLNDIFAMGAEPTVAVALATLPLMAEAMVEEELYQLLMGCVSVLNEHGVALVGGHSAEGAELSLGLTVLGMPGSVVFNKTAVTVGERLIVTKPLGTGVVLAGQMQGRVSSENFHHALSSMNLSNAAAAVRLPEFGVRAATDVTGFGLLGHLAEMLRGNHCGVTVHVDQLPWLPGAIQAATAGIASSLQPSNEMVFADFQFTHDQPKNKLLVDPQTSGGLLFSVAAERSDDCLQALHKAGYVYAAEFGEITDAPEWRIL